MYQSRKDDLLPAGGFGAAPPSVQIGPTVQIGPAAVLAGMVAMDAVTGFGMPLLAALPLAEQPGRCIPVLLLTVLLALCLIGVSGGYSPRALHRPAGQVRLVLTSAVTAIGATALAAWAFEGGRIVHGAWALPAIGLGLLGLTGGRAAILRLLARERALACAPRTVVFGGGQAGQRLARLLSQPPAGSAGERVRLLGYIGDPPRRLDSTVHFLGGMAELLTLIRNGAVDRVIIAQPGSDGAPSMELICLLAQYPVQLQLARNTGGPGSARPELIHLLDPPLCGLASLAKRGEDIALTSLMLIPCLPVMAVIALLIRLDSAGPALFRQRRTGFGDRDFTMLKFRTLYHHLSDPSARLQVTQRDQRVTRIGAWLRRSSLDELPQLFNVLRGDMSIVGPRPHAPGTQAGGRIFEQVVAHYAARHRVRPGVTGLAQVRGLRGPTETEDKLVRRVDSDLEYIENWSIWLDLLVLARTAFAVLRMKNAC